MLLCIVRSNHGPEHAAYAKGDKAVFILLHGFGGDDAQDMALGLEIFQEGKYAFIEVGRVLIRVHILFPKGIDLKYLFRGTDAQHLECI